MNLYTRVRMAAAVLRARPAPVHLPQHLEARLVRLAVEIEHLQERAAGAEARIGVLVTNTALLADRIERATEAQA